MESYIILNYTFHVDKTWPKRARIRLIRRLLSGPVVKKPPVNAGDRGSISGSGRFHGPRSN